MGSWTSVWGIRDDRVGLSCLADPDSSSCLVGSKKTGRDLYLYFLFVNQFVVMIFRLGGAELVMSWWFEFGCQAFNGMVYVEIIAMSEDDFEPLSRRSPSEMRVLA